MTCELSCVCRRVSRFSDLVPVLTRSFHTKISEFLLRRPRKFGSKRKVVGAQTVLGADDTVRKWPLTHQEKGVVSDVCGRWVSVVLHPLLLCCCFFFIYLSYFACWCLPQMSSSATGPMISALAAQIRGRIPASRPVKSGPMAIAKHDAHQI